MTHVLIALALKLIGLALIPVAFAFWWTAWAIATCSGAEWNHFVKTGKWLAREL